MQKFPEKHLILNRKMINSDVFESVICHANILFFIFFSKIKVNPKSITIFVYVLQCIKFYAFVDINK